MNKCKLALGEKKEKKKKERKIKHSINAIKE